MRQNIPQLDSTSTWSAWKVTANMTEVCSSFSKCNFPHHTGHRPQEAQLQRRTARAETWLYLEIRISVNCLCYHHRTTSVMFSWFASAAHLLLASFSYTCVLWFVLVLPLLLLPLLCFCRISSSCPFVLVSLHLCLLLLCFLLLLLLLLLFFCSSSSPASSFSISSSSFSCSSFNPPPRRGKTFES